MSWRLEADKCRSLWPSRMLLRWLAKGGCWLWWYFYKKRFWWCYGTHWGSVYCLRYMVGGGWLWLCYSRQCGCTSFSTVDIFVITTSPLYVPQLLLNQSNATVDDIFAQLSSPWHRLILLDRRFDEPTSTLMSALSFGASLHLQFLDMSLG
jgi:hypothetical protein